MTPALAVSAPVQTGPNWAGLLDPLPMLAFQLRCLVPQWQRWPREALARCQGHRYGLYPHGEWDEVGPAANSPVGSSSLWGSGALVPRWPWALSHPSHLHHSGGAGGPHRSLAAPGLCWGVHSRADPWGHMMAFGEAPGTAMGGCPPPIWRPLSRNLLCGSSWSYRFQPSVVGHPGKSPRAVLAQPLGT